MIVGHIYWPIHIDKKDIHNSEIFLRHTFIKLSIIIENTLNAKKSSRFFE